MTLRRSITISPMKRIRFPLCLAFGALVLGCSVESFASVPVITSASTTTATPNVPFDYQITTTTFTATGLPPGLSIDARTGIISGTPTTYGRSEVTITATNADGVAISNVTIDIQATFAGWQQLKFSESELADPDISGDLASPAGDGIPNLLKYALNLDPHAPETIRLPEAEVVSSDDVDYLTLSFSRLKSATGIALLPQVSSDLVEWHSDSAQVATVSVTDNPDGETQDVVVQSTTPLSTATKQFMRLRVTRL